MNCPACSRNLALTLSVCPSCGTMVKDSVREELATKISPLAKPFRTQIQEKPAAQKKLVQEKIEKIAAPVKISPPVEAILPPAAIESAPVSMQTAEITAKQTSPILVEFQSKNAVLPEWRLQLQNSVRRRGGGGQAENSPATYQKVLVTKGATALKAEPIEQAATAACANPTLENAMKRIEQSRQKYFAEEKPKLAVVQSPPRNFPYIVPNKPPEFSPDGEEKAGESNSIAQPKTATHFSAAKPAKFDTNKLPPLPKKVSSSFEKTMETPFVKPDILEDKSNFLEIKTDKTPRVAASQETAINEITGTTETAEDEGDDRAPMMSRFNAGFFDLLIGAFLSVILLAPFTLANGNLFTFQGLLAFLATCSIVMFIYLTTTIGMMGRTLGMKLFSLELVDIEENTYPSFHQAAVSSSVYIVSLALGGIGFLTLFLNDEKRAAHDLISGTIVVKEYE